MHELVPDGLKIAQAYQWDIISVVDPVDVALKGHDAVFNLKECVDEKIKEGLPVRVHAFAAFVLEQWNERLNGFATIQFDQLVASGESLGVSFIQYPNPELNTLFLGLKNATFLEVEQRVDDEEVITSFTSPKLVIPILDIDSIEIAA